MLKFNFKKYLLSKKKHNIFNIESIKKIKETNNVFYKLKNYVIKKKDVVLYEFS